ncbi:MAG: hypothetical protein MUF48_17425 [Pirellulaceae bacterium]|jgi:hypothetical protein|nr:hypothetical protein [Pirellulaceae bacterium]
MAGEDRTPRIAEPRPVIGTALLMGCALAVAGCQRTATPDKDLADASTRETHHAGLRAERARLVAEQATPLLLQAALRTADPSALSGPQFAAALSQILDPAALKQLRERLEPIYPDGDFRFDDAGWRAAQAIAREYAEPMARYRALIGRTDFRFPVDYLAGFLADLSFLDHATAAHRLEALEAAEALHADRPREAMHALRNMFRISAQLCAPKHLSARLAAAQLRSEALRVVAAVAGHAQADRDLHRQLGQLVSQPLATWPPDADAWIGDRALGIQAYEMVRGGQLLNLLTSEELETLRGEKDLQTWTRTVMKSLDDDEAFYLETMRTLIDSCHEPYYARVPTLHECAARLDRLRDTPRFPFLAAHVLLASVATAMRHQATDRARCEAWQLALAAAAGDVADPPPLNPLTGTPFVLVTSPTRVDVLAIDGRDPGESVSIPLLNDTTRDSPRTSD